MTATRIEGYLYEAARAYDRTTGEYSSWSETTFSPQRPNMPEGSVRNLRAVYSCEEPTEPMVTLPAAAARELVRQIELANAWADYGDAFFTLKRESKKG